MQHGRHPPLGCAPYRTESESEYAKIQYGMLTEGVEQQRNYHEGKGSAAVLK
jgi:hypothetical protein